MSHLQIIHNAVESIKPDTVIFPHTIKPCQTNSTLGNSGVSLTGYIGKIYAETHGCKFKTIGKPVVTPKKQDTNILVKWAVKILFKIQLIVYKKISKNKNVIIATHSAYNLPRVVESACQKIDKSLQQNRQP